MGGTLRKHIIFGMCLFIGVASYAADRLNLRLIRDMVRNKCGDYITTTQGGSTIDTTKVKWQDSTLNDVIESIHRDVCRKSGVIYRRNYITTVSSQTEYDLPNDFLAMREVAIRFAADYPGTGNAYRKLIYKDRDTISADDDEWEDDSPGTPENYYIWEASYIAKVGLDPSPAVAYTGSNYLRIDYVMTISSMTSDTDEPFEEIPHLRSYQHLIVWGATAWCKENQYKESIAAYYWNLYDKGVLRMQNEVPDMPDYTGAFIAEEYGDSTTRDRSD